jgi:pimeloyl-ACP methyl ester carboxylesterase
MEEALAWARSSGNNGKVLLWGSSYSAALVLVLAAEHHDEVGGVLGFSPGELRFAKTLSAPEIGRFAGTTA